MNALLLAGLMAALPFAVIVTLAAADVRRRAPSADPTSEPPPDEAPRPGRMCITSERARCACGHARGRHHHDAADGCGCQAFVYAGGLVDDPGQHAPLLARTA